MKAEDSITRAIASPAVQPKIDEAREAIIALLVKRGASKSVCPSEVARLVSQRLEDGAWRSLMPIVHEAVDRLQAEGLVQLSWKGKRLGTREGPYRIVHPTR